MPKDKLSVNTDISTLKKQLKKDEKFTQGVRLYAVYQIKQGKKAKELEDLYNVSHKSICKWVHLYNSEGPEGLRDKPHSGRPSRLTKAQKEMLAKAIKSNPETFGYSASSWTGPLVIGYIEQEFGIQYKKAQIYNLLRELGFNFQRKRTPDNENADSEKTADTSEE